jgi:MbtH protein
VVQPSDVNPAKITKEITDMDETEDKTIYKVVLNHEEQYSIWPADRENALGWNDAGKTGTKAECLEYIKEVWTDMRPLSLRKKMAANALNVQ